MPAIMDRKDNTMKKSNMPLPKIATSCMIERTSVISFAILTREAEMYNRQTNFMRIVNSQIDWFLCHLLNEVG